VEGEGAYANSALYSNMGADPLYSNVAEVCFNPRVKIKFQNKFRIKYNFFAAWRLQLSPGDPRRREAGGETG
jgi:hypothetical protein